jgi:phospholipase C
MGLRSGRVLSSAIAILLSFGLMPIETSASTSSGTLAGRVQHIVVLMQENRSFDHYFGQRAGDTNPNPLGGTPIAAFHKTTYCEVADLNHSWNGTHQEWDGGKMDGFTAANAVAADPTGSRTMGYYDRTDLPFYYALDNTFAIGDHYFASALTQTFPNRFYLLAGTSFGHIRNDFPTGAGYTQPTVFNLLDAAHVSWKIYYSQIAFANLFAYVQTRQINVVPIDQYYVDASNGNLPQVSFVDPIFLATNTVENDEHPPSNVQVGQNFTANVINALFKSPEWLSSAMFLTYDEHGGFYDHMAPPAAVAPDSIPPMLQAGDAPGGFDRYGIRVPVTVISPWSKAHFVSHVVNDHTSILRFIETRFNLPTLTRRDAAANPMLEFFNFKSATFAQPPVLPPATIDTAQLVACASMPSNTGV